MKKRWLFEIDYYFFMPLVVVIIAASLWLTVSAAIENYKLGRMADQLVRMASVARSVHVAADTVDFIVREAFFDQIKTIGDDEVVVVVPSAGVGRPAERGVVLPWGDIARASFYPDHHAFRFELPVSPSICRRLLSLYRKDVSEFGLLRVDVRSQEPPAFWRKVYETQQKAGAKDIPESEIYSSCSNGGDVVVSLTFSL